MNQIAGSASFTAGDSKTRLSDAVLDAELLIQHVALNNAQLDSGAVKDVLNMRNEIETGDLKLDTITSFWLAMNSLSIAAAPATPSTIRLAASTDRHGQSVKRKKFGNIYIRYRIVTFLFLLLAILLNAYWIIAKQTGEKLTFAYKQLEEIESEKTTAEESFGASQIKTGTQLSAEERANNNAIRQATLRKEQLQTKAKNVEADINGHFEVLKFITVSTFWLPNYANTAATKNRLAEISLGYFRDIIGLTLAPLAFGGLGACVYIVRRLGRLAELQALDPDASYGFRLRISLGCISGLAAAQFGLFENTTLTPLVLAFLAGYSIEVFFSALDRIVGAFSTPVAQRPPAGQ